jgi:hypothetical protein
LRPELIRPIFATASQNCASDVLLDGRNGVLPFLIWPSVRICRDTGTIDEPHTRNADWTYMWIPGCKRAFQS